LASANGFFARQARWHPLEAAFWLLAPLPFLVAPTYLSLASQVAITALFALSLDLVLGYAGLVSLGHAAYFGIGAYTAGLLAKHFFGEPLTGLVVSALVAGVAGYLSSHVIVRFRHLALIMLTLGFGLLLFEAANSAAALTGGADGLQGVRVMPLLGFRFDLYGRTAYAYSLVVLFLCFLVARRLIHSPFGLALRGIRENSLRMPAIGAPGLAHLRKAYTIAAAMAGIAGALLTQTTSTVSLEVLSFGRSADVLVMLILGGAGRLYGGILGAVLYLVARDQLADMNPQYWYFWIGLLLVAVVMFLPNGILGGASALSQNSRKDVRLSAGGGRGHARGAARRTPRPDRSKRRGQDDAHQPDHRHAAARQRRRPARRRGRHVAKAGGASAPRTRAHLPDQRTLPGADCA
jgi:branched-chain amino acid transport system permease protein